MLSQLARSGELAIFGIFYTYSYVASTARIATSPEELAGDDQSIINRNEQMVAGGCATKPLGTYI